MTKRAGSERSGGSADAAAYSQPAYCAVVGGRCPFPVEVLDAGVTLAYPFRAWMKDWADRLVALRKGRGLSTYAPHKHYSSNYLVCDVCKEVRARPIHLSEVTEPNWNVYYEAGFAFGSDKLMVLAEDENRDLSRSRQVFPEYLRASYHHDEELLAKLEDAVGRPSLKMSRITVTPDPRRLYFVDPGIKSSQILDLQKTLRRSRILTYSAPAGGLSHLPTLQTEIYEIASARATLAMLLPQDYVNQDVLNARTCFLMGVAVALEKPALLLVQEPAQVGPADLQMLAAPFASVATMRALVMDWLAQVDRTTAPARQAVRRGPLDIDLGNAWAERDPMLEEYFLETSHFRRAREASVTVFLGRRGAGKSAIALTLAKKGARDRTTLFRSIHPEAFEMQELQQAYETVTQRGPSKHWKLLLGAIWRYLLISQLAWTYVRHFENHHPEPPELDAIRDLINRIPHQEDFVDAVLAVTKFAVEASEEDLKGFMGDLSRQRIYAPLTALSERIPIRLILDNLDVTWDTSHQESRFVLASLIREAERLNQRFEQSAAVLLFLRTDIYNIVKLADPDIDKQTREHLSWNRAGLVELVGLRLRYLLGLRGSASDAWAYVFPPTVEGVAAPDFFVSRTLHRPRELIKLCDLAIEYAQSRRAERVSESDILQATADYSEMLLTDIHGEYLIELPDLYYFVLELSSHDWPMDMDDFRSLIRRASERESAAGRAHSWHSQEPDEVVRKLYEAGVIGLAAKGRPSLRSYFSFDRDWAIAYGAMRSKMIVRGARGARKETWAEPVTILHPALEPILGAKLAAVRGTYVQSRRRRVKRPKAGSEGTR